MRIHVIGLAAGLAIAAATASQASTPDAAGGDLVTAPSNVGGVTTAKNATDQIVIARRGRGADDPAGDDHGGGKAKDKGGKGRGGKDDGPNHDRNDDHGVHGPNHA